MKTYTYEQPYFNIEVLGVGIFSGIVAVLCIWGAVTGSSVAALLVMFAAIGLYQVWNTFVAIANPQSVTLDGDTISFSAFGRTDSFQVSKLDSFMIREFPSSGKMYLRVGKTTLLHGRYWLQTKVFTDGRELFQALLDIEYAKNPDTIKARARRVNTEYLENADGINKVKEQQKEAQREKVLAAADRISKVGRRGKSKVDAPASGKQKRTASGSAQSLTTDDKERN